MQSNLKLESATVRAKVLNIKHTVVVVVVVVVSALHDETGIILNTISR